MMVLRPLALPLLTVCVACGPNPLVEFLYGEPVASGTGASDLEEGPVRAPAYRERGPDGAPLSSSPDVAATYAQYLIFHQGDEAFTQTSVVFTADEDDDARGFVLDTGADLPALADETTTYLSGEWAGEDAMPDAFPDAFATAGPDASFSAFADVDDEALLLVEFGLGRYADAVAFALQVRPVETADDDVVDVRINGEAETAEGLRFPFSLRYHLAPGAATDDHDIESGLFPPQRE